MRAAQISPIDGNEAAGHDDHRQEAPINLGAEIGPEEKIGPPSGGIGHFLTKHGFSVVLPVILGVMVLALLLRSPRDAADMRAQMDAQRQKDLEQINATTHALEQTQAKLTSTQEELMRTQTSLRNTEEALKSAQQSLADSKGAPKATRGTAPAIPSQPLSPEQQLGHSQQELRNARRALEANQRELIANLRELRGTSRGLAVARRDLAQMRLELQRAQGKISDEELVKQAQALKPWPDFLPSNTKALLNDSRLDEEPGAQGAKSVDDVPVTLPETQALFGKTITELTAVMKQLTNAQAAIVQTQSDLTQTQTEQNAIKEEISSLQVQTREPVQATREPARTAGAGVRESAKSAPSNVLPSRTD